MSKGYSAGETRATGRDEQSRAASQYYKETGSSGYGVAETSATADRPRWMPPADQLPSAQVKDMYGSVSSESKGEADGKYILKNHPDRAQTINTLSNKRGFDIGADHDFIKAQAPEFFDAMSKSVYMKAYGRSMDVKTQTATIKRDAAMGPAYDEAWSAASKAFAAGDDAAKALLKGEGDTYRDVREFRGPASKNDLGNVEVKKLKNTEYSIPGRVAAVNAGITAAMGVVNKMVEKNKGLSVDQKAMVTRSIYDRLVSDKHGFLAYREYIPKTAIYNGPTSTKSLKFLDLNGDYV